MTKKKMILIGILFLFFHVKGADTVSIGKFEKIIVYVPSSVPQSVILFVSGDGGWSHKLDMMGEKVSKLGAIVVGIDILQYYKKLKHTDNRCYYPAEDFEMLSLVLQKRYKIKSYLKPILFGYSSGATLVYGILAQAPANTFKGAIAMGFCPELSIDRPLCNGAGLSHHIIKEGEAYYLEKSQKLSAPFIVLQGKDDLLCPHFVIEKFLKDMKMGEFISIPRVGHGFLVQQPWLGQITIAYDKVINTPSYAETIASQNKLLQTQRIIPLPGDLPVTLVPATPNDSLPMAVFISGDGGWTSFDQAISEALAEKGIPVVGVDAQKYFWNARTPQETTKEIADAVRHFMLQWKRQSFILVGYSFGASVVPFVTNLMPIELKEKIQGTVSLSPDENADFEIHIEDMMNIENSRDTYRVLPEIRQNRFLKMICVFGAEEDESVRKKFANAGAKILLLPGGHSFNNNSIAVANAILKSIF